MSPAPRLIRFLWQSAFAAALCAALGSEAIAATQQDYDDCSQTSDIARSMAACTRIIADQGQSAIDRAGAYVQRGNDDVASGKLDEGVTDYSAAIRLEPKSILAYAARSIAYWRKNDRDHAVADYKQAAGLDAANIREMTDANPELKAIRQATRQGVCELATADWETTVSVATVTAYQDHLARFAVCAYAAFAQVRIAALTEPDAVHAAGEEQHAYLGITINNVPPEIAGKMGLKTARGAMVVDLAATGPGAQAGVQKGDIIISLDGDEVGDAQELAALVAAMRPDAIAQFNLLRDGDKKTIEATPGAQHNPPQAAVAYFARGAALDRKGDADAAIADYNKALIIDAG